jgi:Sec-independent protein secretion pathway component TatC
MDSNTKRFLLETLMWISIYFGIAFVVSIFLPFPYSLIAIVIAVLGLGLYRRRRQLRKTGHTTSGGSSYFGNIFGSERAINYYCINCGTKHNEVSCPNCGSKLKKAGF